MFRKWTPKLVGLLLCCAFSLTDMTGIIAFSTNVSKWRGTPVTLVLIGSQWAYVTWLSPFLSCRRLLVLFEVPLRCGVVDSCVRFDLTRTINCHVSQLLKSEPTQFPLTTLLSLSPSQAKSVKTWALEAWASLCLVFGRSVFYSANSHIEIIQI